MFKTDSFTRGIILGTLAPLAVFIVFYGIILLITSLFHIQAFMKNGQVLLLCIAPNFLLVRYFYNAKKMEHTGGGLIAISFVYIALFFILRNLVNTLHLPGLL